MNKYVFMKTDECGDDSRVYGSDFLESEHEFPDFEEDDMAMTMAFEAWRDALVSQAQREWDERHDSGECTIFLEETYESQFKRMRVRFW